MRSKLFSLECKDSEQPIMQGVIWESGMVSLDRKDHVINFVSFKDFSTWLKARSPAYMAVSQEEVPT